MDFLANLTEAERAALVAAPACITVLIAGADKKIDKSEKTWASKVVTYRTFTSDPMLNAYYTLVKDSFQDNLSHFLDKWTPEEGETTLSQTLSSLSPILSSMDVEFSQHLKASWRSLAKEVAEASGGFLGIGSVSAEEKRLIELDMLA
ncbi:MAG: hypothetical protein AAF694_18545 [Bacteroidota bacterium]